MGKGNYLDAFDITEFDREDMVIVGTPDEIITKLMRYEAAGVDQLLRRFTGYEFHEPRQLIDVSDGNLSIRIDGNTAPVDATPPAGIHDRTLQRRWSEYALRAHACDHVFTGQLVKIDHPEGVLHGQSLL